MVRYRTQLSDDSSSPITIYAPGPRSKGMYVPNGHPNFTKASDNPHGNLLDARLSSTLIIDV